MGFIFIMSTTFIKVPILVNILFIILFISFLLYCYVSEKIHERNKNLLNSLKTTKCENTFNNYKLYKLRDDVSDDNLKKLYDVLESNKIKLEPNETNIPSELTSLTIKSGKHNVTINKNEIEAFEKSKNMTIIIMFLKNNQKKNIIIHFMSLIFLLGIYLSLYNLNLYINIFTLLIPSSINILIVIQLYIMGYRVKHGYYGTNEEESRELIKYILKNEDNFDKQKGTKIFNDYKEKIVKEIKIGKLVDNENI